MTIKKYLEQIPLLENKIQMKIDIIKELRARAESCTADFNERVQTTQSGDSLANIIIKINDYENELDRLIDEQINLKHKVVSVIDGMSTPEYIELLHRKYLKGENLVSVATNMSYSYPHIKKMHGWALQEFERNFYKKIKDDTK